MSTVLPPPNYPLFPGNTAEFVVTALQPDGVTAFNLTSATVSFQSTFYPGLGIWLFTKAIGADVVIPTPTNGQIFTWYRPADTLAMAPNQTLYNYVTVTDSSGNVYTVLKYIVFLRD